MLNLRSKHSFDDTLQLIKSAIKDNGLNVLFEVNHQQNAKKFDIDMDECTVLGFGNPQVGSILMIDNPEVAYELPLRMLIAKDKDGVFVFYNKPTNFTKLYTISESKHEVLHKMTNLLEKIASTVI